MYSLTMVASSILNALCPAPLAMVSAAIVYPDRVSRDEDVHAVAEANPVGIATAGEDRSTWLTWAATSRNFRLTSSGRTTSSQWSVLARERTERPAVSQRLWSCP